MTPDRMRSLQTLAGMPKDAPERCLYAGHDYRGWSLWVPEAVPLPRFFDNGTAPSTEVLKANRYRTCHHCGARQVQDRAGVIQLAEDPCGIEKRQGHAIGDTQ